VVSRCRGFAFFLSTLAAIGPGWPGRPTGRANCERMPALYSLSPHTRFFCFRPPHAAFFWRAIVLFHPAQLKTIARPSKTLSKTYPPGFPSPSFFQSANPRAPSLDDPIFIFLRETLCFSVFSRRSFLCSSFSFSKGPSLHTFFFFFFFFFFPFLFYDHHSISATALFLPFAAARVAFFFSVGLLVHSPKTFFQPS